jgi:peroxiredoxin Q/BCP
LLVDEDKKIADTYGVWQERERDGQKFMGIIRSHFVIDEQGKLTDVQYAVAPEASPELSVNAL